MLGALISLFVTVLLLPVKLLAALTGLIGPMVSWGVWLTLLPLKVVLLPLKLC